MKKIIINGKTFSKSYTTGVKRYQIEILKELDKIIDEQDEIELLLPKNSDTPTYKNIKVKKYGKLKSNLWEQIELPYYIKKENGIGLNLGNVGQLVNPGIVCLYDMNRVKNIESATLDKIIWYKILFRNSVKRALKIITISEFSKKEIADYYKINANNIEIVNCGWQHIETIKEDSTRLKAIGDKEYFFSLGTITKHKNLKWVIEVAKKNPKYNFVISGFKESEELYKQLNDKSIRNIISVGYLTDEQMKYVMKNAKALIFPSFYEGFGIPIMEALALGTKAIVSDIPVLNEIYEDTVYYINPNDANVNLDELLKKEVKDKSKILSQYSWEKSANKLWGIKKIRKEVEI